MVLLRSREVTPKSVAKDSTPSNDREPPDAPPPLSPSVSLATTTPRRSFRLASRSPTADEAPQTASRKRKTTSPPGITLMTEIKSQTEGTPAAEGTGTQDSLIDDMTKQDERKIGGEGLGVEAIPRGDKRTRRWTSAEKGKGKLDEVGVLDHNALRNEALKTPGSLIIDEGQAGVEAARNPNQERLTLEEGNESEGKANLLESEISRFVDSVGSQSAVENVNRATDAILMNKVSGSRMEQFKEAARKNAARFAHVVNEDEDLHGEPTPDTEVNNLSSQGEENVEDWPGPFSTAMKIIRDRSNRMNLLSGKFSTDKPKSVPINWTPRENGGCNRSKPLVPSLQQLCIEGLAKNADAITSLQHVPDVYRHRLSQLLCDSRKMNTRFLQLLVCGSPSEIRIRDCSWLTEEEFKDCIQGLDASSLEVLQLDFCGRSLPDYALVYGLAQSLSSLPVLTTVSLSGAYRLSDVGLRSLVSAAPALQCLNLSQCSLISATSISILADSVGSTLKELYINDCQSIVAMDMLPALLRLQHLEVLSLGGIETVSDNFIICFCAERGDAMKELVLSDCGDEAIAAFIEVSGEALKDLSLNNVKQVSGNTAVAVARHARDLQSLDISWCRNLEDEAVGMIVDSCLSLKVLKIFGCDQLTDIVIVGHSNPVVEIIGKKMTPAISNVRMGEVQSFPTHYTSVLSTM
ncbi:DNA repair protein rhp7 [Linum perenne]